MDVVSQLCSQDQLFCCQVLSMELVDYDQEANLIRIIAQVLRHSCLPLHRSGTGCYAKRIGYQAECTLQ